MNSAYLSDVANHVDATIRARKTLKVMATEPMESPLDKEVVQALLEAAGWAPLHRPAAKAHQKSKTLNSIVPWRCYLLDQAACRSLRQSLLDAGDRSKIPPMLAAASTLIQVTWLPNPNPAENNALFAPTLENMEHIAAASAAIQNLLIAATARGIQTYWSSGGPLRNREHQERLGIPDSEILLGSIFLFPQIPDSCQTSHGKLRDQRGQTGQWAKWVSL